MKKTKQIERIEEMEKLLDEADKTIRDYEKALRNYSRIQKNIDTLEDYYFSKDWLRDFEDDEKHKFPDELKRGVLSEDGLYNLLGKNDDLLKKTERFVNKQSK